MCAKAMKPRSTSVWISLMAAAFLIGLPAAYSTPTTWTPAAFEDPDRTIERIHKYLPDEVLDLDRLLLRCMALVTKKGSIKTTHCYSEGEEDTAEFNKVVRFALRRSRFIPATIDGVRREVLVPFSVRIADREVHLYMHHFHRSGAGKDDSAPQMYAWGQQWDSCITPRDVWLAVPVSATGEGRGGTIVRDDSSVACAYELKKVVGNGRFVPAMKNGVPVEGIFLDAWNYRRSFGAKLCMAAC